MALSSQLPLAGKILGSISAVTPAVGGAIVIWQSATYREPDPGPGNMPSFFPTAFFGMLLGTIMVIWSLPQVAILASVWRGRSWALLTLAILCLIQGTPPIILFFTAPRAGQLPWPVGIFGAVSIAAGVVLIAARHHLTRHTPARLMQPHVPTIVLLMLLSGCIFREFPTPRPENLYQVGMTRAEVADRFKGRPLFGEKPMAVLERPPDGWASRRDELTDVHRLIPQFERDCQTLVQTCEIWEIPRGGNAFAAPGIYWDYLLFGVDGRLLAYKRRFLD